MKKIFALIFMLLIALNMIACSNQEDALRPNVGGAAGGELYPDSILEMILRSYGEDWPTSESISLDVLEHEFGIEEHMYEEVAGQMARGYDHFDIILVVQASPSQVQDVEEALSRARDALISNAQNYPRHVAKINASEIVREEDFVVFILAGRINEDFAVDSPEGIAYAREEIGRGVDTFLAMVE